MEVKTLYKKWWFWLITVLLFFTFIDLVVPDSTTPKTAEVQNDEEQVAAVEETTPEVVEVPTVDYTVFSEEDISYAGCKRVAIKIQVAGDAEQDAVDATLVQILEGSQSEWDDITVWAYSDDIDPSKTAANKGSKEFSNCQ